MLRPNSDFIDITAADNSGKKVAFVAAQVDHSICSGGNDISIYVTRTGKTVTVAVEANGDYFVVYGTEKNNGTLDTVRKLLGSLLAQNDADEEAHELDDDKFDYLCTSIVEGMGV